MDVKVKLAVHHLKILIFKSIKCLISEFKYCQFPIQYYQDIYVNVELMVHYFSWETHKDFSWQTFTTF